MDKIDKKTYIGIVKFTLESMVDLAKYDIQGELCAIENYKNTILCVQNNTLKATIERIIEDEELHVVVLKAMLATAKEDRK